MSEWCVIIWIDFLKKFHSNKQIYIAFDPLYTVRARMVRICVHVCTLQCHPSSLLSSGKDPTDFYVHFHVYMHVHVHVHLSSAHHRNMHNAPCRYAPAFRSEDKYWGYKLEPIDGGKRTRVTLICQHDLNNWLVRRRSTRGALHGGRRSFLH